MSEEQNAETNNALKPALSQMRAKDMSLLQLNIRVQNVVVAEGSPRAQINYLHLQRLGDLRTK